MLQKSADAKARQPQVEHVLALDNSRGSVVRLSKHQWRVGAAGFAILGLMLACAAIYPEIRTPTGPPPNTEAPRPPPPDDYVYLYLKAARVPSQTRDGRKWGGGEGLPSTYAILFLDGTEIARTSVQPNTLEPTWPDQKKANYKVEEKTRLRIEVWEDHGLFPHPICLTEVQNLPNYLDAGETEINCEGGAELTLAVEPAHARWGLGFYYELRTTSAYVTRVIAASSAGRAGLKPGDQILSIMGHSVAKIDNGELQSLIRSNSTTGIRLKVSSNNGPPRKVYLKDEAIYPLVDDGIPLNQ